VRALRLSALVPIVLTLAVTLTACGTPKATLKSDAGLDAAPDAHVVTVDRKAFPKVLNPPGPEGALFYAGSGEGCHRAKTPRPEQVPDLRGLEAIPCPDALRDPAWNRCVDGVLFASADGKKCLCVTGGPNGVGVEVPCPEVIKP